jgi:hypothetical protein
MSPEKSEKYISLEEWARIVAYAWVNEDFKNEFELHPRKAIEDLLDSKKNVAAHNKAKEQGMIEFFEKIRPKRFFDVPPCPKTINPLEIDGILSKDKDKKPTPVIPYLTI